MKYIPGVFVQLGMKTDAYGHGMMTMKPLLQAILDREPVSAAEIRELLIRHVMSGPSLVENAPVTEALISLYESIWGRDHGEASLDILQAKEAKEALKSNFREAYKASYGTGHDEDDRLDEFFVWPRSIPRNRSLPRELVVVVGQAMGRRVGNEMRKYHDRIGPGKN